MIFLGLRQAVEDCPPISRLLDTKKQIGGTHRSRRHNLQHPYATKFAVFHEKNGHKWPFSGHMLIFFGFVQAVEGSPPPILRVLDAKKQVVCMHRLRKHNLQHLYAPKLAIFYGKTAKNGRFLVTNWVLWPQTGSCRAPPPPILRVLDAKKHAVWTHRLSKHNLQHSYAPKSAIFEQNRRKRAIFLIKNRLFFLA